MGPDVTRIRQNVSFLFSMQRGNHEIWAGWMSRIVWLLLAAFVVSTSTNARRFIIQFNVTGKEMIVLLYYVFAWTSSEKKYSTVFDTVSKKGNYNGEAISISLLSLTKKNVMANMAVRTIRYKESRQMQELHDMSVSSLQTGGDWS